MNVTILSTSLFPDRETLDETISYLEAAHYVYRCELDRLSGSDEDWDGVVDELLGADRIITL
ncbi:MAG TPA: hypothetical protein VKA14_05895 [Gammaproteobacteria bacterium]|nr:hypothetical protein [Gammaproteobacteria bacterium]